MGDASIPSSLALRPRELNPAVLAYETRMASPPAPQSPRSDSNRAINVRSVEPVSNWTRARCICRGGCIGFFRRTVHPGSGGDDDSSLLGRS